MAWADWGVCFVTKMALRNEIPQKGQALKLKTSEVCRDLINSCHLIGNSRLSDIEKMSLTEEATDEILQLHRGTILKYILGKQF